MRVIKAVLHKQRIVWPKTVVDARRIDIAAKTLFARAYLDQVQSSWPEEVYRAHLKAWNGFFENEPRKNNYDAFRSAFLQIIHSYQRGSMQHEKSPVLVDTTKGYLLKTGGHRVAAAIAVDHRINIIAKKMGMWWSWNTDFFRGKTNEKPNSKLAEKYLDAMTIEYVSLFSNRLFAAIIFPAAKGYREEARQRFETMGRIVNYKTFKYNEFHPAALIHQIYFGEIWNYKDSVGLDDKAGWCFDGTGDIQVYIIESDLDHQAKIQEKEYLRQLWGVDKNSIHMTDTAEEVNMIARMFFHDNTRNMLKQELYFSEHLQQLFSDYRQALPKDYILRDRFCIEASAVLDLFGLRRAADLDYMSFDDRKIGDVSDDIELHTIDYINYYYKKSRDDMIFNPSYHFYYAGCKIVQLEMVLGMKQNKAKIQSSQKDKKDIKLIKEYFRGK